MKSNKNKSLPVKKPLLETENFIKVVYGAKNGDKKAQEKVIRKFEPIINYVAYSLRYYNTSKNDLVQEGYVGLWEAVKRVDPERVEGFFSYAETYIREYMMSYIIKNQKLIKMGTTKGHRKAFYKLKKEKELLQVERLTPQTAEIVAKKLNITPEEALTMDELFHLNFKSIHPIESTEDENEFIQLQSSEDTPEEIIIKEDTLKYCFEKLNKALDELADRERQIIEQRYLTHQAKTLKDIGKDLDISLERVRQIEKRTLSKLKEKLHENRDCLLLNAS